MTLSKHKKYMEMAFKEALKGTNRTLTNPLVGAVVVKNGNIVGYGHHAYFGGQHAEEQALIKAGKSSKGSDLYVTLEPCSSYGKRPPCTDIINKFGVKNVYFESYDLNIENNKKASKYLKKFGINSFKIDTGLPSLSEYNAAYVKIVKQKLPFIILKAGLTLDGKLCDKNGCSKWITSQASRIFSHKLRASVNAILIGSNTFNKDNPKLNIRAPIKYKYNDPYKVILTGSGNLKLSNELIKKPQKGRVIIATTLSGKTYLTKRLKKVPDHISIETFSAMSNMKIPIKKILIRLKNKYNIASILVEGGAKVFTYFTKKSCFDKFYLFYSPRFFGTGGKCCSLFTETLQEQAGKPLKNRIIETIRLSSDILTVIENRT